LVVFLLNLNFHPYPEDQKESEVSKVSKDHLGNPEKAYPVRS
jgi:hypothetical protein